MGITFDCISGTSAGSIVGALYANGHKPDQIFELIKNLSIFKSVRPAFAWTGLLSLDGLKELMLKEIPGNKFSDLKIPLTVAATDIRKGKIQYFTEGDLARIIMASCCIPAIFNPVSLEKNLYVDGGIDGLVTIGDVVAAIIGEVQDEYEQDEIPTMQDEPDGSVLADARTPIPDFEEKFGDVFTDGERDMADTLGGFVFTIAGCVPSNGELIRHEESGLVFEILESTSHRIERLRIHPSKDSESKAAE
jgi:hypothetical protein